MRKIDSRLRRNIVALVSLVLVGAWFAVLAPRSIGGPAGYVLVSGESMEPTMHTGDFVVTRKQGDYAVGDVVAYRIPAGEPNEGRQVIHRIVGGSAHGGYELLGDNNDKIDPWRPTHGDIIGKRWVLLPRFGHVIAALRSPIGLAAIAGLLTAWAVLGNNKPRNKGTPEADIPTPETEPHEPDAGPENIEGPRSGSAAVPALAALVTLGAAVTLSRGRKAR